MDPEILAIYREIVDDYLLDEVIIMKRAKSDDNAPDEQGDDGFGGVANNLPGDTNNDGYVQGLTFKVRLTDPRTQFNIAERSKADGIVATMRMLMVFPATVKGLGEDGREKIELEDQILHTDHETNVQTLFQILSFQKNDDTLGLHVIVQAFK